jgi:hypothetical protein
MKRGDIASIFCCLEAKSPVKCRRKVGEVLACAMRPYIFLIRNKPITAPGTPSASLFAASVLESVETTIGGFFILL